MLNNVYAQKITVQKLLHTVIFCIFASSITHKDTIKIEITKWHKHAKMI